MFTATAIFSALLALVLIAAGVTKLRGSPQSLEQRDELGLVPELWRSIGVLELCGAAGLLLGLFVAPLGVAAAVGVSVLMALAAAMQMRDGQPARALPALALLVLALLVLVLRTASS